MTERAKVKAVFTREFHWTRPDGSLGFGAKASPEPQVFPRDFIAAAVAAGAAQTADPALAGNQPPAATARP